MNISGWNLFFSFNGKETYFKLDIPVS